MVRHCINAAAHSTFLTTVGAEKKRVGTRSGACVKHSKTPSSVVVFCDDSRFNITSEQCVLLRYVLLCTYLPRKKPLLPSGPEKRSLLLFFFSSKELWATQRISETNVGKHARLVEKYQIYSWCRFVFVKFQPVNCSNTQTFKHDIVVYLLICRIIRTVFFFSFSCFFFFLFRVRSAEFNERVNMSRNNDEFNDNSKTHTHTYVFGVACCRDVA